MCFSKYIICSTEHKFNLVYTWNIDDNETLKINHKFVSE